MCADKVQRKPLRLIAAACNNMGIGKDGHLPWDLPTLPEHAHFLCQDFDSMISLALLQPLCDLVETIWVVGGPRVYQEALMHPWCELIFLTDIMADFDCDVFFPQFDRSVFKKQQRFPGVPNEIQEENGVTFKYDVFKREICSAEVQTNMALSESEIMSDEWSGVTHNNMGTKDVGVVPDSAYVTEGDIYV